MSDHCIFSSDREPPVVRLAHKAIHGHIYRTVAELRAAVDAFVDLYNEQWLPEKNGFISPSAIREAWYARQAQGVAA